MDSCKRKSLPARRARWATPYPCPSELRVPLPDGELARRSARRESGAITVRLTVRRGTRAALPDPEIEARALQLHHQAYHVSTLFQSRPVCLGLHQAQSFLFAAGPEYYLPSCQLPMSGCGGKLHEGGPSRLGRGVPGPAAGPGLRGERARPSQQGIILQRVLHAYPAAEGRRARRCRPLHD